MPTFTPLDFVTLPRSGAQGALGLGRQVLSAAAALKKLPPSVVKAHATLTAAHTALQTALVDQFGQETAEPKDDSPAIQKLDQILDNCWGGLDDRFVGLAKLPPGTKGAAEAVALRGRLFSGGLSFLKLPYRLQWSESQIRLDLIEREDLGPLIADVAGEQFLPAIQKAHADYGAALGMTKALPAAASAPQVRAALDAFTTALRVYVVKVMATVDEDVPATQAAADALLKPLAEWTPVSPPKPTSKVDAPEGAEPKEGNAPGKGDA